MKTLIIILLNICFLFSCSLPQNRNLENVYVLNLDEANNNDFYSMFDSVTYISLETQSDNEIGQISRILYHYGKYIVTDMLTNRVFIFNEDGKYYSKIDAIGNGPEEYVQITDITIDKNIMRELKCWMLCKVKLFLMIWKGILLEKRNYL